MEWNQVEKKFRNLSQMIGNTPLLEIKLDYRGEERTIYAKAEYYNLTGSIKDRMAFHVLKRGYEKRKYQAGRPNCRSYQW